MPTPTSLTLSDPIDANEALLRAVSVNAENEAERLLTEDGADVNHADQDGLTAHRIAVAFGLDDLAGSLRAKGADPGGGSRDKLALIDRVFRHLTDPGCPGAAVSVARAGELLFSGGYGLAQLEYDVPISPTTIFHVASVSKQVTAFSVAMLVVEGSVALDEDIRAYLPDTPDFGEPITPRHLLHHTSGLRDQWELLGMAGGRMDDVITTDDILTLVRHQQELNFPPGSEFLYCNTGYTLLAAIVARVTGETFHNWTRDRLFVPLRMTDTHFHDNHRRVVPNRAYSYQRVETGYITGVLSFANVGATSLFTTVEDFAKWTHNLDTGAVGGPDAVALMHETAPLNDGSANPYAFGLMVGEFQGLSVVEHGGGDAGFKSHAMRFPDHGLAVHVFGNLADLGPAALARRVASVYLEDELAKAAERRGSAVSASDAPRAPRPNFPLDDYVGEYALDDGSVVRVRRSEAGLVAEAAGHPPCDLISDGGGTFSIEGMDVRLTFRSDVAGAVTFLGVQAEERLLAGARRDANTAPEPLRDYVGEYHSRELDTTYWLSLDDDGLVVEHRRHGKFPLIRTRGDAFRSGQWYFQVAEFTRDEGRVTGFRLTSARVRRLQFLRVQGA